MTEQQQWYSIVYRYHDFFIHSSVDGHLGCFQVLATANSAAVNTSAYMCLFELWFSQGICPVYVFLKKIYMLAVLLFIHFRQCLPSSYHRRSKFWIVFFFFETFQWTVLSWPPSLEAKKAKGPEASLSATPLTFASVRLFFLTVFSWSEAHSDSVSSHNNFVSPVRQREGSNGGRECWEGGGQYWVLLT